MMIIILVAIGLAISLAIAIWKIAAAEKREQQWDMIVRTLDGQLQRYDRTRQNFRSQKRDYRGRFMSMAIVCVVGLASCEPMLSQDTTYGIALSSPSNPTGKHEYYVVEYSRAGIDLYRTPVREIIENEVHYYIARKRTSQIDVVVTVSMGWIEASSTHRANLVPGETIFVEIGR